MWYERRLCTQPQKLRTELPVRSRNRKLQHRRRARSGFVIHTTYRVLYYAPGIKSYVKLTSEQYDEENVRTRRDVSELLSFKPGS